MKLLCMCCRFKKKYIVSLYVDDLLVMGGDSTSLMQFVLNMESESEMSNAG